jgi:hypothetical protein
MLGIYISGGSSGAHLNPAVSIPLWIYVSCILPMSSINKTNKYNSEDSLLASFRSSSSSKSWAPLLVDSSPSRSTVTPSSTVMAVSSVHQPASKSTHNPKSTCNLQQPSSPNFLALQFSPAPFWHSVMTQTHLLVPVCTPSSSGFSSSPSSCPSAPTPAAASTRSATLVLASQPWLWVTAPKSSPPITTGGFGVPGVLPFPVVLLAVSSTTLAFSKAAKAPSTTHPRNGRAKPTKANSTSCTCSVSTHKLVTSKQQWRREKWRMEVLRSKHSLDWI